MSSLLNMARTFVLGIDGGSWRILNDLRLPEFKRLAEEGATGKLRSTLPPITYPAWKCYSTGKNPGELEVFGFVNLNREQEKVRQNNATHFESAEIWDYLSNNRRRVGVVNMPSTYPPHNVNGIMIAGPNSGESGFVKPNSQEQDVKHAGYVPMSNGHRLALQSGGETTISAARELIKSRFDVSRQMLKEKEFDFFNLTIYCTDPVQHHFWGGQEVKQTYRVLDQELGMLLDQLEKQEEQWNVIMISDHGFRPIKGAVYVDSWMQQEGFLTKSMSAAADKKSILTRIGVSRQNATRIVQTFGLEKLVGRLPDSFTSHVNRQLPSQGGNAVEDSVNWEQSDAIFLMGGIYVLDQDRKETIIDRLEDAINSFTLKGKNVFDEVYRTDEIYSQTCTKEAPDLIPLSNDFKLLGFSGDGSLYDSDDDWIAAHEMEGLFVGDGPSFRSQSNVKISIYDVMPTVLHAMGDSIPTDIDGSVRQDLFQEKNKVTTRDPIEPTDGKGVNQKDTERMKENLQQLGYLE